MRHRTDYDDVVSEVVADLREALGAAVAAGIAPERIALDPGIGFAKTAPQSFRLLARLEDLLTLGRPLCLGVSRKSFLGAILDLPPAERMIGTAAAVTAGVLHGAGILRVHDVEPMTQAVRIATAIRQAKRGAP
jgi:dihydropteroate synthase